MVEVDEDTTGAGVGGAVVVVVCSLVVVFVTVGGLLQPTTNREPAESATIVKMRSLGIVLVMA